MNTETQTAPATLGDIEAGAKAYADTRTRLHELLGELNAQVTAIKRQHMGNIKRALARTAERQAELQARIESAPELFVKPRTLVLHGVKVGYTKGKGSIEIVDAVRTMALIRRYLPGQAETLIRTEEKPHKPALVQLSVADLKRIGCTVTETGDLVVIKAVDGELDKMVDALLRDALAGETEAVAA